MNYKYLVIGNSSTFDTTLNYIQKIRNNGDKVDILFCSGTKFQIIDRKSFIYNYLIKNKFNLFELSDFLKLSQLIIFWKKIFINNKFDYIKTKKKNLLLKLLPISIFNQLEKIIGNLFLSNSKINNFFKDTDYLLIDFRHKYDSFGKQVLENSIKNINLKKIFLLPHACHYTRPYDEFRGLDSKTSFNLPTSKVLFWIPMRYDELNNYKKYKYEVLGYPEISNCIKNPSNYKDSNNVLILVRNFQSNKSKTKDNSFVYEKQENLELFNLFLNLKVNYLQDKKFIFKLHPKISKELFIKFISDIWPDDNYIIVYDSIIAYLDDIFLSISSYTTLNILTISKKIPTLIYNCRFQRYVNKWSSIKDIYEKFSFFCEDDNILKQKIKYILINNISHHLEKDQNLVKEKWIN